MTSTVLVQCHCARFYLTLSLSELPQATIHCHCTMCRHITGAPYASGLSVPAESSTIVSEAVINSGLRMYVAGPKREWWFCVVCGSHVLVRVTDEMARDNGLWKVMIGAIEGIWGDVGLRRGRLERVLGHIYVGDTGDGGVAMLFQDKEGQGKVKYWEGEYGDRGIEDINVWVASKPRTAAQSLEERLEGRCHCGGVKFHLLRMNDDTTRKHRASLCMCRSCRLSVGQPLTGWAMRIPLDRVIREDGKQLDSSLYGTLRRYQSSEHKSRDFCSVCGASVFSCDSGRPGVVDILLGVLRSDEGVRAMSWLHWDEDGIYPGGDVVDDGLRRVVEGNSTRLLTL